MKIIRGYRTTPSTVPLGQLAGGTCFRLPNAVVEDGCGVYIRLSVPSNLRATHRLPNSVKYVAHLESGRIYEYPSHKEVVPVEAAAHVALPKDEG